MKSYRLCSIIGKLLGLLQWCLIGGKMKQSNISDNYQVSTLAALLSGTLSQAFVYWIRFLINITIRVAVKQPARLVSHL